MTYERETTKAEVSRLLSCAESCMKQWDETPQSIFRRDYILQVITGLKEHIDDSQERRIKAGSAAFRAITDSISIEESDAGELVLQATEIYSKYV